jgi:hypothetical protein
MRTHVSMVYLMFVTAVGAPIALNAQDAGAAQRTTAQERRDARRDAAAARVASQQDQNTRALAERQRVESSLREALAQVVRQRLNLSDDQTTRLLDVNRRFSDDRLRLAREEIRIRRELRRSINGAATDQSPVTAKLLDELLETQRKRLDIQQQEQVVLAEFLTPEQRARYIGMMEQLRRRIQVRADSAGAARGTPPE